MVVRATEAVNVVVKNMKTVLKEWLGHSAATVDFSVGNTLVCAQKMHAITFLSGLLERGP